MSLLSCCGRSKKAKTDKTMGNSTSTSDLQSARQRRDGTFASIFRSLGSRVRKTKSPPRHSRIEEKPMCREDIRQIADHQLCCKEIVGTGTFGVVYKACAIFNPKDLVAVKRIETDEDYETREVDLHKLTNHPNVVRLKQCWTTDVCEGSVRKSQIFMVMEYVPTTLDDHLHHYSLDYRTIPAVLIKVFVFQLFRALNYLHTLRILHRDVKPSNCLVDMYSGVLKICDFGCAKRLNKRGGPNRTYICSRYYRAPELVLNNTRNDETIDVWAAACVLAECFRGWPLFPGKTTEHQFGAIADVLGNPSPVELYYLNPKLKEIKVKTRDCSGTFDEHFPRGTPDAALDLMARMFVYAPKERVPLLAACADPYFDQLRLNVKTLILPSGTHLPQIFDFSPQELQRAPPGIVQRLLPSRKGAADLCYLDRPVYKKSTSVSVNSTVLSIDSMTTEPESVGEEVFSELESFDVDEKDIWDCRVIRVVDDETASSE